MPHADATTLVQFVVDTAGVPVEKTYRVLKSASVEFTNEVMKVASAWRISATPLQYTRPAQPHRRPMHRSTKHS